MPQTKFYKPKLHNHTINPRYRAFLISFLIILFIAAISIILIENYPKNHNPNKSTKTLTNATTGLNSNYLSTFKESYNNSITINQTSDNKKIVETLDITLSENEISLDYISAQNSQKDVFQSNEDYNDETTKSHKERESKLFKMIDLLGIVKHGFKEVVTNYHKEISLLFNLKEKYYYYPFSDFNKDFTKHLFNLQKVAHVTLKYILKTEKIIKEAKQPIFQVKILYFLVFELIIKKYYKCKAILISQTDLFLNKIFKHIKQENVKYYNWLKGKVLCTKVLNMAFMRVDVSGSNMNPLVDFLELANLNKGDLFTVRNFSMVPFYILMESFYFIFYMFEIDAEGNIIKTHTWFDELIREYNKDNIMTRIRNNSEELVKLWINSGKFYDLVKLMKCYCEIIILISSISGKIYTK